MSAADLRIFRLFWIHNCGHVWIEVRIVVHILLSNHGLELSDKLLVWLTAIIGDFIDFHVAARDTVIDSLRVSVHNLLS